MRSIGPKLSLIVEAGTGGFYVAITRSFFIIMLSYAGYNLTLISIIFLIQAIASTIYAVYIYKRGTFSHNILRILTIVCHGLERIFWMILPLFIYFKIVEICIACIAMFITTPVGIFLNYLIYSSFTGRDIVDIVSKRFAIGSATSIIGILLSIITIWIFHGNLIVYTYLYLLSGFVGLIGTSVLLIAEFKPIISTVQISTVRFEVEIGKVTSLLFYILFCSCINLIYMIWIPYMKSILKASQIYATIIAISGSVGTIVGSLVWRSNNLCRISLVILVLSTCLPILISSVYIQPLLYFIFSTCTMGGFILITAIYSTYVTELGTLRVSALSQIGYEVGTLIASIISMLLKNYYILFLIATGIGGLTLSIVLIAIPEVAIVPRSLALNYARTIYNISITSLTYTTLFTKETAKLFIRILGLTLLISIIYAIYKILLILVSI